VRHTQFNERTELFTEDYSELYNKDFGLYWAASYDEPIEEQTFTRREKKLYRAAIGQRTEAKRSVKKRKASALGKAKQTCSKARRTARPGK
jgi:hypothetical protein